MTSAAVSVYSPPRTYPVPKAVVAEAVQGFRWARAYNVDVPDVYQYTAAVLASGGSVDSVELNRISLLHRSETDKAEGFNPGEHGYPNQTRILAALAGGAPAQEWVERSLESIERAQEKQRTEALDSIQYDGASFHYLGICASGDPDVITMLARSPVDDPMEWSYWDAPQGEWVAVEPAQLIRHEAVDPDSTMVAEIVAALAAEQNLLLSYAEPVAFVPQELTASAAPDDVEETTVFVVVDEVDTTAVLAAIKVEPGPKVYLREGRDWVHDEVYQEWFTSDDRPVVAALVDDENSSVLSQIDSLETKVLTSLVDAADDARVSSESLRDFILAAKYDLVKVNILKSELMKGTLEDKDLNAVYRHMMDEDEVQRRRFRQHLTERDADQRLSEEQARRSTLRASLAELDELRALRPQLNLLRGMQKLNQRLRVAEFLSEVPIAAAGGLDRNRGNAERLRRYWLHGPGAAKIRWGVKGDWRRCYRQLFKHLGPRAKGYCQLRHKEATGLWTGDRLHRAGINAIKADAGTGENSANPVAHTGIMIALYPLPELAEQIALESGEPADELHVTLAYLGDSTEQDAPVEQDLVATVRDWVKDSDADVLEGVYSGKGIFVGDDMPEESCTILTVDINTLPSFRQSLVNHLTYANRFSVSSKHGFTPHTTLAYGDRLDDVQIDEPIPVRFATISVVYGESRTDIPLGDVD